MKKFLFIFISTALVVSGFGQTRNVLVGTNNAVVQPTNFWSADASNARVGLGLGTAATNPASAFQPSSSVLTNLANNNGSSLTNLNIASIGTIAITNISGLQPALDGKLATNGSAANLTSFPLTILQTTSDITNFPSGLLRTNGNASGLTNFPVIPITSGGTGGTNESTARAGIGLGTTNTLTIAGLVSQNLTIVSGGGITLQSTLTNAASFRTNIGLSWTGLTSVDASAFRTALGLGTSATNPASAFQPSSAALSNLSTSNGGDLTNIKSTNIVGVIPASNIPSTTLTNISGTLSISSGGTGATNAATARTNLGLGWSALTNTDATNFRNAIGLGGTNVVRFESIELYQDGEITNSITYGADSLFFNQNGVEFFSLDGAAGGTIAFRKPILFLGTNASSNAAVSRTNLGLPWSGLTNANAVGFRNALEIGTTNTLTIAGITAQNITVTAGGGITLQSVITNAASFRTNISLPWSGLTNANSSTFQAALFGSNTNPVLVNTNGEVVSPTNFWAVAPISTTVQYQTNVTGTSTNAATNSRNLFLFSLSPSVSGITNTVTLPTNPATTFEGDRATITHLAQTTNAVTAIRQLDAATNLITLNQLDETVLLMYRSGAWRLADNISYVEPIFFSGTNAAANSAASVTNLFAPNTPLAYNTNRQVLTPTNGIIFTNRVAGDEFTGLFTTDSRGIDFEDGGDGITRTNLGLGATWLTNTSVTNFRSAIGLGETNSVTFSALTLSSDLNFGGGDNIVLSTTNGTKIGTATNQLLGFYNQTPIAQPSTTGVTTNGFTQGSGNNIHPNSTFTGGIGTNAYTISDIVAHLKSLGLIAP